MSVFHYTTIRFPSPYAEGTDHPQGFILIKFLKSHAVSLVYSPDDQRFYIRKILRVNVYSPDDPPEIQFSNLATDSPFTLLPFLPVLVESACLDNSGVYGLILEAYNGGTQENLVTEFAKQKRPVPESYVWHFIEQTARAYAYLHFGHVDGKKVGDKEWVPIVHRDGAANNIFLHFRDPDKKARKSAIFINPFPKVVLGDLGISNRVTDTEEQSSGGVFDQEGISQWEDVVLFGEAVRTMLYTSTETEVEIGGDINSYPRLRDANTKDIYSEDLIAALEPFEAPPGLDNWENDNVGILPDMRHVAEVLLPQAIQKVQEYKQDGGYESVRWVQPHPTPFMPFVVRPNDKQGLREIFAIDYEGDWVPEFDAVDFRFNTAGTKIVELEQSSYPECLQEGYDLTIPKLAFSEPDSVWATVNYADELLKSAVQVAEEEEAESGERDPDQVKDIELMKAARKVLRPVHHEERDPPVSSASSSSSSASNNDPSNDPSNDDSSADGSSSTDSDPVEPDKNHRSKSPGVDPQVKSRASSTNGDPAERDRNRRSKSPSADPQIKSRASFQGANPKDRSRSRSRVIKSEGTANLMTQNTGRKRKREVSMEYNRCGGKRVKGLPLLRETITTTTTRESF
ncbi:hypothetical protein MMC17_007099 [Xylographa soralifera]|nr:hypothetical protein [Xylographa soralifera]